MNKICTNIKQSKRLIELGIDVDTADMYYQWYSETESALHVGKGSKKINADCPAWSLSALLSMMPKSICIKQSEHSGYFYFLEWQFANDNSLRYVGHDGKCLIDIYSDHDVKWKDSIDTTFEMVCWLKENKKI